MKLRNPTLIRLVAFLASVLIRGWMSTLRLRLVFQDGRVHPTDPRVERFIYAFWHESLLAPTVRRTRVHILISQHADGEFIAQVCRFLGYGVVRGSSTRGGSLALLELMDRCTRSHLAVTPDGPRGPRRQVKVGIVYLASRTGMAIVPVGVGYTRAWRFGCRPASTATAWSATVGWSRNVAWRPPARRSAGRLGWAAGASGRCQPARVNRPLAAKRARLAPDLLFQTRKVDHDGPDRPSTDAAADAGRGSRRGVRRSPR
jgi:lysophospholipid acyltransferase (LPLAT)-like uncharacterized protein